MTDTPRYAELHAHSAFSFLDGASQPEELAAEAHRLGLSALAVTDHDGLYGVVRFSEAARDLGLPTVFGAELHLPVPGVGGPDVLDPPTGLPDPRALHLPIIARGPDGYAPCPAPSPRHTWPPAPRAPRSTGSTGSPSGPPGSGSCSPAAGRASYAAP